MLGAGFSFGVAQLLGDVENRLVIAEFVDEDKDEVLKIKKEFFDNPLLRPILLKLGGIPVDRSRGNNIVNQVSAMFSRYETLNIIITPEGTRKLVHNWKKGFYYIALRSVL